MSALHASIPLVAILTVLGCTTPVQHGLDERQANEIQAALAERGIEATRQPEGGRKPAWSVVVPTRRVSEAVQLLADLGLPRSRPEGWREVYGKGGWIPSASEERALYLTALSGELSRTLESFDGVVAARVHLVLPVPARSGQPAVSAKASVFLRARPDAAARLQSLREQVRGLVAGAVDGLTPEAVTLVLEEAALHRHAPDPPTPARAPLAGLAPVLVVSGIGALGWGILQRRRARRAPLAVPSLRRGGG